jgi:hypothetical protein
VGDIPAMDVVHLLRRPGPNSLLSIIHRASLYPHPNRAMYLGAVPRQDLVPGEIKMESFPSKLPHAERTSIQAVVIFDGDKDGSFAHLLRQYHAPIFLNPSAGSPAGRL